MFPMDYTCIQFLNLIYMKHLLIAPPHKLSVKNYVMLGILEVGLGEIC